MTDDTIYDPYEPYETVLDALRGLDIESVAWWIIDQTAGDFRVVDGPLTTDEAAAYHLLGPEYLIVCYWPGLDIVEYGRPESQNGDESNQ